MPFADFDRNEALKAVGLGGSRSAGYPISYPTNAAKAENLTNTGDSSG
jgi:hypothetical protein